MNFITGCRLILAIILLPTLAGCVVGAAYQKPDLEASLQDNWTASQQTDYPTLIGGKQPQQAWWGQFNDPHLSQLISELVASNLTLAQARERVVEARARRGIVKC